MVLNLSREELRILKMWAMGMIEGGHWGDGMSVIGEEESLLIRLKTLSGNKLKVSNLDLRVLKYWLAGTHSSLSNFTGSPIEFGISQKNFRNDTDQLLTNHLLYLNREREVRKGWFCQVVLNPIEVNEVLLKKVHIHNIRFSFA